MRSLRIKKATASGLFSLLFHGMLFGLIFGTQKQKKEIVEIEFPKTAEMKIKKGSSGHGRSGKSAARSLQRFYPANNPFKYPTVSNYNRGDQDSFDRGLGDNPLDEWGEGGGQFHRVREYLLMDQIYGKINGLLFYPGWLAYKGISGVINARVVLNQNGKCLSQYTNVEGASPYLRSYINHLLRKFCLTGIPPHKYLRPTTNVDLSFHFEFEGEGQRLVDIGQTIIGNVLLFHRSIPKSPLEWQIGPIKGVFPVPMIYLNIEWIYENWEKIVEGRDPMDEYRKE